ncbi:hypothetical protein H311_03775 [Anncaliia algerae PRA109]|nr:hypothetical protein H311_03775 [Anncaliia algerae PRA109]
MIYCIIGFNTNGENRFYRTYTEIDIEEVKSHFNNKSVSIRYLKNYNAVFHRYANMVIAVCVDKEENLLLVGTIINRLMQTFDLLISNICELNFVYALDRIYEVIDRFIMDGKIIEMEPIKLANALNNE